MKTKAIYQFLPSFFFVFFAFFFAKNHPSFHFPYQSLSQLGVYLTSPLALFFNLFLVIFTLIEGRITITNMKVLHPDQQLVVKLSKYSFTFLAYCAIFPCNPQPYRAVHLAMIGLAALFFALVMAVSTFYLLKQRDKRALVNLLVITSISIVIVFNSRHKSISFMGLPEIITVIMLGFWNYSISKIKT